MAKFKVKLLAMEYKDAMKELEEILADINQNQSDIDQLATKVARASELIKLCKTKLKTTEEQIQTIFED